MKRIVSIICCICIFITGISPVYATTIADKQRVVRVGCAVSTGYHQKTENGTIEGYGYDYEQALAQYAGWKIEYVEDSWTGLQDKLEDGEIDLLGFMIKTEDREKIYDFADNASGHSMTCLATEAANTDISYEDYASFDGKTIAYQEGNANLAVFQAYEREHGFQTNLLVRDTYQDVYAAIAQGEADAGLLNNYQNLTGYNVVAEILPAYYYYGVKKGNTELLEELNDAISKVDTYLPDYMQELYKKYYADASSTSIMFTREEQEYLETHPTVDVVPACREQPFESCDQEQGTYEGIVPSVLNEVNAITGITFTYVHHADRWDYLANHEGNVIGTITHDFAWAREKKLDVTQPFIDSEVTLVAKGLNTGINSVALCHQDYLNKVVADIFPEWKIKTYDTPEQCVAAVKKGEVDGTLLNTYEADFYTQMAKYQSLQEMKIEELDQDISFGVSYHSDPLLYSILSKALLMINTTTYDSINLYYMDQAQTKHAYDIIYTHPVQVAVAAVLLLAMLCGVVMMFSYVRAMRKKNHEIELANQGRTDFFARMSHDMRTPMNGILGMLTLAEEEKNPAEVQNCIRKARDSGNYMLSLINDTLDLQKLESGKMTLEYSDVAVTEFLQGIIEMVTPSAQQKNLILTLRDDFGTEAGIVRMDVMKVKQILTNLLSNAIKFTPEGGHVELRVRGEKNSDAGRAACVLELEDTGIGMSEEFIRDKMYKVYSQEHTEFTDRYAGSGLGLSIVKNLVELMQGTIAVQSEIGEGTTYTIHLVFDRTASADVSASTKYAGELQEKTPKDTREILQGKHILVCEDHPLNAEIEKRLLEKQGCIIDWAEDGAKGVEQFRRSEEGTYAGILMDIRMPVMNGIEAARAIRGLPRADAKTVRIVAVTANAYEEDIQRSMEAGMDAHLSKPIDAGQLYRMLADLIESTVDVL